MTNLEARKNAYRTAPIVPIYHQDQGPASFAPPFEGLDFSPVNIFPPCSNADDLGRDDADDLGRAVWFVARAWNGWTGQEDELTATVARIHRVGRQLHLLVREAVSEMLADNIRRAAAMMTGGNTRGSDVFFHFATGRDWGRVWQDKRFDAEADFFGTRPATKLRA